MRRVMESLWKTLVLSGIVLACAGWMGLVIGLSVWGLTEGGPLGAVAVVSAVPLLVFPLVYMGQEASDAQV